MNRIAFESSDCFEILVGNTNVFKWKGLRVRSGQFDGIANINLSKQKVPRFERDMRISTVESRTSHGHFGHGILILTAKLSVIRFRKFVLNPL